LAPWSIRDLSLYINDYCEKGVEVLWARRSAVLRRREGRLALRAQSGREILADTVVAGIGIAQWSWPRRQAAGGQDHRRRIFAGPATIDLCCRDVASFYNPAWTTACVERGQCQYDGPACRSQNMASAAIPYHHLPYFYSNLFDLTMKRWGSTLS
jgi:hypothetical protein